MKGLNFFLVNYDSFCSQVLRLLSKMFSKVGVFTDKNKSETSKPYQVKQTINNNFTLKIMPKNFLAVKKNQDSMAGLLT